MDKSKIYFAILLLFTVLTHTNVQAQSLDSLLMMAVENNSELKALHLEYEAELERKNQVGQLQNPGISVGVPILKPETRLGPQIVKVGASQMFPWFGTLEAKENVTLSIAKAKFERIAALKLEIFQEIKSAYYSLCLIDRKLDIVNQNTEVCHSMESIALSKVESGEANISDVLQAQQRIQKHHHHIDLLEIEKQKYYAIINVLINRDVTVPINVDDTYEEPKVITINVESYRKQIEEHHPLIVEIDAKIEASKFAQEVNSREGKPSFGVGVDYALVGERIDMNPAGNGRDILIPKIMVKIPLYRKKFDAKHKQEDLYQQAFEFEKETIEDKMIGLIQNYRVEYDQTVLHIKFIEEQIKITQQVYDLTLASYSAEGKGFDDLLQINHQLINYQLELEESLIKTYQLQANIDRLTDF